MKRILIAVCASAGMVLFGAQNWNRVPISLLFGAPTRIRLVFLLGIALAAGYLASMLRSAGRELRLQRELRELRRLLRDVAEPEPPGRRPVAQRRRRVVEAPAERPDPDLLDEEDEEDEP